MTLYESVATLYRSVHRTGERIILMPQGYITVNKAIYDRWKPDRLKAFHDFLKKGTVLSSTTEHSADTIKSALIYDIDHPDFLPDAPASQYILNWGRVLSSDGYNYIDAILSLTVHRPNNTYDCIARYDYTN